MVKLTPQQVTGVLKKKDNIRNVLIFAPLGHASSTTHALMSADGVIVPEITDMAATGECGQSAHVGLTRVGRDDGQSCECDAVVGDDGKACVCVRDGKSSMTDAPEMAIYYKMTKQSLRSYNGKREGNNFLLNLISPQLPCSSTQFNADISIADGALVVVDSDEGVTMETERFLHQALHESIIPVLSLNLMDDTCLLNSGEDDDNDVGAEQLYIYLVSIIKKLNEIVDNHGNKLLPDVKFYPDKGNVVFSCCSSGWGFTLNDFADYWAPRYNIRHSEMLERLWGDHFFDTSKQEWTSEHTGARTCHRGFIFFCYKMIMLIKKYCLEGNTDKLVKFLGDVVSSKLGEKELVGSDLLKHVMQAWLPAGTSLLDMMVMKLPSVSVAQRYRVEHLYKGPLNDLYANAIRACDPGGPLMIYIYKVVPAPEKGKTLAFGRIFSGTLHSGLKVHVIGPTMSTQNKHAVKSFEGSVIWIGKKQEYVERVPCGNMVVIIGLEQPVTASCTITNQKMLGVHPMRAISLSVINNEEIEDMTLVAPFGSKEKDFSLPYAVYITLYLHQREGIRWLWFSHCRNRGGAILADDMGLGKTRQVSAFLRGLFHSHIIKTAMVIAPASVIDHWGPELIKVGLESTKFTQGKDKNHLTELKNTAVNGGVILTTYEIVRSHEIKMSSEIRRIDYMFADEGHRIKNYDTGTSQALARMDCKRKIVVTGTPVQNNLTEFYSLMSFCCPGLLGSYEDFETNFILPIDRGKHKDAHFRHVAKSIQASELLKKLVGPFLLRRTKDLLKLAGRLTSNKFEVTVWLKINPLQQKLYEALVGDDTLRMHGSALEGSKIAKGISMHPCLVLPSGDSDPPSSEKISHRLKNNLMNHLQTFCLDGEPNDLTSSRLDFILYFVPKLIRDGHKILMFSKSPRMLKLVQSALRTKMNEEKVIRMDGSTSRSDRLKLVEAFQCKDGPLIFLMTTIVGGFGITLTAATRVLIIDPSDNPTHDNQAVDRAYRIGQEKDVVVYRLITCGTIEEHTYRRQVLKGETACTLLEDKQCKREINKQEGFVLRVPSEGFDVSITHHELVKIHGNVFDRSLNREKKFIKNHESVYDIFNHNATFSLEEDDLMPYHMPQEESYDRKKLPKGRGPQVKEIPKGGLNKAIVKVPRKIVPFLQGRGYHKVVDVAHYSGAMIRISGATNEIILNGLNVEIREAEKLMQKIIQETSVQLIYIKRDALLVCAAIENIQDRSGAHVKVHKVEDDSSEQPVEIIGTAQEIEMAKQMVMRIVNKKN